MYINPQPSEVYLTSLYNEDYFSSENKELGYVNYGNEEVGRINKFKKYLSIIEKFHIKNKQVFDIGAGFGYFLGEAQKRGWEISGVELSKYAKNEAEKRLGIDIVESLGELSSLLKYNLITMFDFIEHVRSPMDMLKALSNISDKGSLLMVRVPVVCSKEGIRKGDSFFRIDHLYNFSKEIIIGMIKKVGYDILEVMDEPAHVMIVARRS